MNRNISQIIVAAAAAAGIALGATTASAEIQKTTFNVVGSWGNLNNYKNHEGPFWKEVVPKASGGKITGNIKPITEIGLKGFEVMRLLKQGVYDEVFGVIGYVAGDNPVLEGVDLAGIAQDIKSQRKVTEVYRNILASNFEKSWNAKLMGMYSYPSQMMWCNAEINSVADMKGKKVRVYSATLGDFVEGIGGQSVTIAFAEVVPALQKKVADCGITGTMPAYKAKWHEVATHVLTLRVGWGVAFVAMNKKKWKSLNKDTQKFLLAEHRKLEDRMWKGTESDDNMGLVCNTGGPCPIGTPGKMKRVTPSKSDEAARRKVLDDFVLKRWAQRCLKKDKNCVKNWNATVGKYLGLTAKGS